MYLFATNHTLSWNDDTFSYSLPIYLFVYFFYFYVCFLLFVSGATLLSSNLRNISDHLWCSYTANCWMKRWNALYGYTLLEYETYRKLCFLRSALVLGGGGGVYEWESTNTRRRVVLHKLQFQAITGEFNNPESVTLDVGSQWRLTGHSKRWRYSFDRFTMRKWGESSFIGNNQTGAPSRF